LCSGAYLSHDISAQLLFTQTDPIEWDNKVRSMSL